MLKIFIFSFLLIVIELPCFAQWSEPIYSIDPPIYTTVTTKLCYNNDYALWPGTTIPRRTKHTFFYRTDDWIVHKGMFYTCRSNYDYEIAAWSDVVEELKITSSIYWPDENPPHSVISRLMSGTIFSHGYSFLSGLYTTTSLPGHAECNARGGIRIKVEGLTPNNISYSDTKSHKAFSGVICKKDFNSMYVIKGHEQNHLTNWPLSIDVEKIVESINISMPYGKQHRSFFPITIGIDGYVKRWTTKWHVILISENLIADGYEWESGMNRFSFAQSGGYVNFSISWDSLITNKEIMGLKN